MRISNYTVQTDSAFQKKRSTERICTILSSIEDKSAYKFVISGPLCDGNDPFHGWLRGHYTRNYVQSAMQPLIIGRQAAPFSHSQTFSLEKLEEA